MKEKQAIQETFTEMATHYEEVVDSELNLFWGWSYHKFLQELVNQTELEENQRVLDIATGTLVIPRKILEKGISGLRLTGLDLTESMLRRGQAELEATGAAGAVDLTCGDAMALPYERGSFDVVVSGLAAHHMNVSQMLAEMRRVLKPGGLLSIIDVATGPIWDWKIFQAGIRIGAFLYFLIKENSARARAEAAAVENLRTAHGWEQELLQAGFGSVRIKKLKSKYKWLPEPLSIQSINFGEI